MTNPAHAHDPDPELVAEPVPGQIYIDHDGQRHLEITDVQLGDPLGREIIGLLSHLPRNGHTPRSYATDMLVFAAVWSHA